jgi:cytochrome c
VLVAVPLLVVLGAGTVLAEGNAEAGKKKVGPSLHGIIGSPAGGMEGFKYSKAMMESGVEWTEENLDKYLTKPKEFIPGNKMIFPGLKTEQQRADVIAYIKEAAQ